MAKREIRPYHEPAGGWGAAAATGSVLAEQKILFSGGAALLRMNQQDGFDCPGCGWGDPQNPAPLEFCENGAKALAWEATAARVTPEFFRQHTVSALARQSDYWLEQQGRLTHPLRFDPNTDCYVPITWEDAHALIANELRTLSSPHEAEFYTSGRTSNEAAFLYQLMVRLFGTNNFPDCSNFCHEPTSVGLPESIGVGKGTILLHDFEHADAIFILGQNPGTNSPRMMTELRAASKRGARIVVFNPLRERALERFAAPQNPVDMATLTSTPIASDFLQVRVGGDVAALKGIMKSLLEMDAAAIEASEPRLLDIDFIRGHTSGFEALASDLAQTAWVLLERQSGLSIAQMRHAAQVYARAERVIACWGMGITQHRRGTQNVQQIVNLLLLRGNIGRPGAGLCPVRGHSNVQGNRTVGITEKPRREFLDQLERTFGFTPPSEPGHDVAQCIEAILSGRAKVLMGLGGNFVAACPDTSLLSEAIARMNLTVMVATKLNRSAVVHGRNALLLPCLARSEVDRQSGIQQRVTVEDAMSMVHASRGHRKPPSAHLRSEVAIVAGIARATVGSQHVDWQALTADYAKIRDLIEQVFPPFQGYNARINQPGGFHLSNSARERIWNTSDGKAQFKVFPGISEDELLPNQSGLWLTTLRSHDQYNTTIYSYTDRYRGVFNARDVLFLNPREMRKRQLQAGDRVDVRTLWDDGVSRVVRDLQLVEYDLPDQCCAAYYPETNPLLPLKLRDERANTPAAKSIPVVIERPGLR